MSYAVCTCGYFDYHPDPGETARALHAITCHTVAATQPHAMVDGGGDVYYPDSSDDATYFAERHGARPLDPDAFAGAFETGPEAGRDGH